MNAKDLDNELDCPICSGSGQDPVESHDGSCRRCEGEGYINRYGPNDPSTHHSGEHVVLTERVSKRGALLVESIPIEDENTGGFNGRYGDWVPEDMTDGPMAEYQQDMKDRLQNKLGTSGPYSMPNKEPYEGAEYGGNDLPKGTYPKACPDCSGGDLCADHCVSFVRSRGDDYSADVLEQALSDANV